MRGSVGGGMAGVVLAILLVLLLVWVLGRTALGALGIWAFGRTKHSSTLAWYPLTVGERIRKRSGR